MAAVALSAQTDGDLVARRLIELRRRAVMERWKRPNPKGRLYFRDYHGNAYFFRDGPGEPALAIQLPTRAGEEPTEEAKAPREWRFNQAHFWESLYNINLLKIATAPNHNLYHPLQVRNDFGVRDVDQHLCNRLQVPFLEVRPVDTVLHPTSDLYARLLTMYRAMTLHAESHAGHWRIKRSDNGVHMQPYLDSHHAALLFHPVLQRRVIFLIQGTGSTLEQRQEVESRASAVFMHTDTKYKPGRERSEGAARDVEQVFVDHNCVMMVFPPCEYGVATLYAKHKDKRYALEVGGIFYTQDNVDHWVPQASGPNCPCCTSSRIRHKDKCPVHKGNVRVKEEAARA